MSDFEVKLNKYLNQLSELEVLQQTKIDENTNEYQKLYEVMALLHENLIMTADSVAKVS